MCFIFFVLNIRRIFHHRALHLNFTFKSLYFLRVFCLCYFNIAYYFYNTPDTRVEISLSHSNDHTFSVFPHQVFAVRGNGHAEDVSRVTDVPFLRPLPPSCDLLHLPPALHLPYTHTSHHFHHIHIYSSFIPPTNPQLLSNANILLRCPPKACVQAQRLKNKSLFTSHTTPLTVELWNLILTQKRCYTETLLIMQEDWQETILSI